MQCCEVQSGRDARRSWWRGASGCTGSGVLLALLPKCPLCLAAYLGLWMGASWATPLAREAKPVLLTVFAVSVIALLVRCAAEIRMQRS